MKDVAIAYQDRAGGTNTAHVIVHVELVVAASQGLVDHMEAEERFVLPAFAHVDQGEAVALLREHGLIRENLLELGIAVDLHCIRYERSQELFDLLRGHAQREERLLYRWADDRLSPSIVEAVKARVAA